ncbi:MAG: hypothetical protein JO345_34440 [Streptosporangiaceae bacterium]|nr:hypothetical protein [Streptosporangiaceae bacterium]
MTTTTETASRTYFDRDYARFADALRRARKNKTPGQLERVDALTLVIAGTFGDDNPGFDAEAFTRSARLRIETTLHDEYATWAGERGYGTEPGQAPEHYSEFYASRYLAPGPGDITGLDEDEDLDDEPDDDHGQDEDQEDDAEE